MSNKTCKTCGECKPLTMFYRRADAAGGYKPNCKRCESGKATARYRERRATGWVRNRDVRAVEPVWPLPTHSIREGLDSVRLRKWRGPVNHEPMRCRL